MKAVNGDGWFVLQVDSTNKVVSFTQDPVSAMNMPAAGMTKMISALGTLGVRVTAVPDPVPAPFAPFSIGNITSPGAECADWRACINNNLNWRNQIEVFGVDKASVESLRDLIISQLNAWETVNNPAAVAAAAAAPVV